MEQLQIQMKDNRSLQSENDNLVMQNMDLTDFQQKSLALFKNYTEDVDPQLYKNNVNELLLEFTE